MTGPRNTHILIVKEEGGFRLTVYVDASRVVHLESLDFDEAGRQARDFLQRALLAQDLARRIVGDAREGSP